MCQQHDIYVKGELGSTPNPVDRPLLHESRMQAVLDGERGNVQIVGSNETPRLVIKKSQKSFARFHRSSKAALGESDSHCFYRRQFNRYTQSNNLNAFHSWDIG